MAESKRPRLSLQIGAGPARGIRSTRTALMNGDPKSPTAFNTLTNVYATAIERSTPVQPTPLTAINLSNAQKIHAQSDAGREALNRVSTPYTAYYPDTPLSDNPTSPAQAMQLELRLPSTMTSTPPLSAGPVDPAGPKPFSFAPMDIPRLKIPTSPISGRGLGSQSSVPSRLRAAAPYSHPRALHSILRNSPLPPPSALSPVSQRRQSVRLMEKAARRVEYDSPIEQTIITERYIKSHVDLLADEASPYSASPIVEDSAMVLDLAMAYQGNETRDGGQTPGPFEEMRRRMAGLATETPIGSPGGIRKRKKKEKKRKWVWTIGREDDDDENEAVSAIPATAEVETPRVTFPLKAATPEPLTAVHISVEPVDPEPEPHRMDVAMSDTSSVLSDSRATTPFSIDLLDMKTPTMSIYTSPSARRDRLASVDLTSADNGQRRDTPIPPDLVQK